MTTTLDSKPHNYDVRKILKRHTKNPDAWSSFNWGSDTPVRKWAFRELRIGPIFLCFWANGEGECVPNKYFPTAELYEKIEVSPVGPPFQAQPEFIRKFFPHGPYCTMTIKVINALITAICAHYEAEPTLLEDGVTPIYS